MKSPSTQLPHSPNSLEASYPRTTIGLSLRGLVVEEVYPGGPAAVSALVGKGDEVVAVNDVPVVARDRLSAAIIGDDTPDSAVLLNLLKKDNGRVCRVVLKRIPKQRMRLAHELFVLLARLQSNACATEQYEKGRERRGESQARKCGSWRRPAACSNVLCRW